MINSEPIQKLRSQVTGRLLLPGEAGYEQARLGWNLAVDQHPALILNATSVQDVLAGVNYARAAGLPVAVQSTGHGLKYPADGCLLIVTTGMAGVHLDVEERTARVEAGAVWKQVLDRSAPFGLAPLLGSSPHVGVVGYTLGGGVGWLARKYGLAADSLRYIDLVTPDGQLRRASPDENSELFWGLRGGGGNFGVVTSLKFNLFPVPSLYGGSLTYPIERAAEALRFYREWVKTLPGELTSSITLFKFPDLPQLPAEMRGKQNVILRAACAGGAEQGQALLQPWLDWITPDQNTFREMPFEEVGTISNDPVDPVGSVQSNVMLDSLSDAALDLLVRYAADKNSPLIFCELRHLGGAIARAGDAPDNALSNREAGFFVHLTGPAPTPALGAAAMEYINRLKNELRPYLRGGFYLNFVGGSEARSRIKEAYPEKTYQRLLALKGKYDPDNLFRYSYPLVETKMVAA